VFISYSHSDRVLVTSDIEELKHHGIPLWSDKALDRKIGEYWDEHAIDAVKKENCRVFVLYVSFRSLVSDQVLKEFSEAKKRTGIKIIPVLIGQKTVTELLNLMRENGYAEKADIYGDYFGDNERMLYIRRNAAPYYLGHFESLLSALFDNGISTEYSVYDHFLYVIENGECVITGYSGIGNHLEIPECISGYPVTTINESAFAEKKYIESVSFPRTVRLLRLGAFRETGLKKVSLPDTVVEVQTACFRDCEQLEIAELSDNITYLAEALFRGCKKLRRFDAPHGVTRMEEAVFRNCSSLEEVNLPGTLKSMTEGGFYGCSSLKRLSIPQTVIGAEIQSFDTCPLLERIRIGNFVFDHGKGIEII
ncbi:MAG: leucine-rich repeat protein, partial [Clostridia bacterium]|nr:leucine-rich repeat protein [Clostridia bacterium]